MKKRMFAALFSAFLMTALIAQPQYSFAEEGYSGKVTVGIEGTDLDHDSAKHGEYNGVDEDGTHFVGDAEINYDKGTYFMELDVEDIGHDDRSISATGGKVGTYDLKLEYSELPKLISNTGQTPFIGVGSNTLSLPAGFTRFANTTSIVNNNTFSNVELETERKKYFAEYSRNLRENLKFKLSFMREEKEGIRSIGGTLGIHGGWTSSAILPEPIDYTTDELRASVEYADDKKVVAFEYYLSNFNNANESLTWDNPLLKYSNPSPLYPTTARLSLPPDNEHERFSLTGAYNISDRTRVSALAEYGKMEQNESLLPYSINNQPPPRTNAQAEIKTTHLSVNLSSRPSNKLSLGAKYRFYKTDNKTPRDTFLRVINDTAGQVALTDGTAAINMPFDYKQNKVSLDAIYKIASATSVKLGLDHDRIDRDYREVEKTEENIISAGMNSRITSSLRGALTYSHAERDIKGHYDEESVFDEYHTSQYFSNFTSNDVNQAGYTGKKFDNHPDLRKFDIAERERDKYGATLTILAPGNTTVGLFYNKLEDDYSKSLFGLQESETETYTVDVTTAVSEDLSVYAFYTRENLDSKQASRYFQGDATTGPPASWDLDRKFAEAYDSTRNWHADHETEVDTVGLGTRVGFLGGDLTVDADYSYSKSESQISFTTGSSLTASPVPELMTKQHTLDVTGRYRLDKKTSLALGYGYERYKSDDWATDGLEPDTIQEVLSMTGSEDDYKAHMVKLFLTYKM